MKKSPNAREGKMLRKYNRGLPCTIIAMAMERPSNKTGIPTNPKIPTLRIMVRVSLVQDFHASGPTVFGSR